MVFWVSRWCKEVCTGAASQGHLWRAQATGTQSSLWAEDTRAQYRMRASGLHSEKCGGGCWPISWSMMGPSTQPPNTACAVLATSKTFEKSAATKLCISRHAALALNLGSDATKPAKQSSSKPNAKKNSWCWLHWMQCVLSARATASTSCGKPQSG